MQCWCGAGSLGLCLWYRFSDCACTPPWSACACFFCLLPPSPTFFVPLVAAPASSASCKQRVRLLVITRCWILKCRFHLHVYIADSVFRTNKFAGGGWQISYWWGGGIHQGVIPSNCCTLFCTPCISTANTTQVVVSLYCHRLYPPLTQQQQERVSWLLLANCLPEMCKTHNNMHRIGDRIEKSPSGFIVARIHFDHFDGKDKDFLLFTSDNKLFCIRWCTCLAHGPLTWLGLFWLKTVGKYWVCQV